MPFPFPDRLCWTSPPPKKCIPFHHHVQCWTLAMKGGPKSCCGQERSQNNPKKGGTSRYQHGPAAPMAPSSTRGCLIPSGSLTSTCIPQQKPTSTCSPRAVQEQQCSQAVPVLPESFLGAAGPQPHSIPNVWVLLSPHCPKASVAQAHTPLAATKFFCLLVKAWERDQSLLQMGQEACETGSNKIVIIILGFVPHDGSVWLGVVREKKRGRESRMESGTGRERGRDRPITEHVAGALSCPSQVLGRNNGRTALNWELQ